MRGVTSALALLLVVGAGYFAGLSEGTFNGVYLWPNIVAMAISGNSLLVLIIAAGYILNSFQIVNNCYIGMTRVMVAMSLSPYVGAWSFEVGGVHATLALFAAIALANLALVALLVGLTRERRSAA